MRYSQVFGKTVKSVPGDLQAKSHKLLYKGGFIRQISAGRYAFLPLGFRVWEKIYNIIKKEMEKIGAQQLAAPTLHPIDFWKKTNRDKAFGKEMMVVEDHHGARFALGGTAEGLMVELVKKFKPSHKDLPLIVYQFSTKFRDEKRPRGGLLRLREFMMKDAYSFAGTEKDALAIYEKFYKSYEKIAKEFDIKAIPALSVSGAIGGDYNHEFMVPSEAGEGIFYKCGKCKGAWTKDYIEESKVKSLRQRRIRLWREKSKVVECSKCKFQMVEQRAIEWGHIFKQDHFYTKPHKGFFIDKDGKEKPMWMGAYGIGIGRSMAAIVETHNDQKGIIWPETIAPFKAHLIEIRNKKQKTKSKEQIVNSKTQTRAEVVYKGLQDAGIEVLYDDREGISAGEKFADADLIGCPVRLVVSEKTGEKIEYKKRNSERVEFIKTEDLFNRLA